MAKQLDVNGLADEAITSSPDVDTAKAERAKQAFTGDAGAAASVEAQSMVLTDDVSLRHGRVAARSVGIGFKSIVGEPLEDDISGTMGDVFGELFGLISRTGSKAFYWGLLGLTMVPVLGAVGFSIFKTLQSGKKGADND